MAEKYGSIAYPLQARYIVVYVIIPLSSQWTGTAAYQSMSSDLKHIRDEILRVSEAIDSTHKYEKLLHSLLLAMFNLCLLAEHVEQGKPLREREEKVLENSFDSVVRSIDRSL